jgi:dTDP-4-amino-4,6-dideoxygalactose transaminase
MSNYEEWVKKARFLATQARDPAPHYEHSAIGYNYRLSNVCAAIGRGQLEVLSERVEKRREIFEYYQSRLSGIPGVSFQPEMTGSRSNRWLTTMVIERPGVGAALREKVRLALEEENIESRPLWKPMHLQPVFKDAPAFVNGVSERLFTYGLCLPSGSSLTEDQLDRIVTIVRRELEK